MLTRVHLPQLLTLALLVLTVSLALSGRLTSSSTSVLARGGNPSGVAAQRTIEANRITVHAAGRGYPWIKLGDGVDMPLDFSQEDAFKQLSDHDQVKPLALAAADFDEDGTPDLISGYGSVSGGFLTLLRGNVDSIFPNSPEAQRRKASGEFSDRPFLSQARAFDLTQAPDFIGAGDFDADGHWDAVTASRRDNALYLLTGDGHGNFAAARRIELPGRVTALATGEVNRGDGLTDIVAGVSTEKGAKALVFESPNGALQGKAEEFDLSGEASAVALGNLDDKYTMDIAVTAGRELVVVYGRDRKLSLDEAQQATVGEARVRRRTFPFELLGVAMGDFNGDHQIGLSLLTSDGSIHLLTANVKKANKKKKKDSIESWKEGVLASGGWRQASAIVRARVSSIASDVLVVIDPINRRLGIVVSSAAAELKGASISAVALEAEGPPLAVLPMRLNADALSDLVVLMSDRAEPSAVMTRSGGGFSSSEVGATDFLPAAAFVVTTTNDSGAGSLRQAIINANGTAGLDTIGFAIGTGPQTITPTSPLPTITDAVVIDGTTQPGFAGSPLIELNGSSAGGFSTTGFVITAGNCTVRGLVINRFANRGIHLTIGGSNVVEGNFLGTDINSTADLGNAVHGISMFDSPNNMIGGTDAAARNVISGNDVFGVSIENNGSIGNQVVGNFIGTDVNGAAAIGNSGHGVLVIVGSNNTVGGTTTGAPNIVSGNGADGIRIDSGATANLVQGNFVGTDVSGNTALGNVRDGVDIVSSPNNTVGGTTPAARNVLSGSNGGFFGVAINLTASIGNIVQGNLIGTNASGNTAVPNSGGGVFVGNSPPASNNAIGGTVPGARNIISGNNGIGININSGSVGNLVQSNFIGTDVTGTVILANQGFAGITMGAVSNTIGGTQVAARNVISGNTGHGLFMGSGSTSNLVQGNFIGTDVTGSVALGNGSNGVFLSNAPNNFIGGPAARNLISGNVGNGVSIQGSSSTGNQVQGNFIGTGATGTTDLGNSTNGIFISNAPNTLVEGNVIAFNALNGVLLFANAGGNPILSNAIFSNNGLGIDLGNNAVTSNDSCDADTGPNNLQNFPVLTSAFASIGGVTTIEGTLNSTANTAFTIQFFSNSDCDPSGFGEGQTLIGSTTVTTNATCNSSFRFTTNQPVPGQFFTATATDPAGNTSEFSQCIGIGAAPADVAITKSASTGTPKPGDKLTYTIIVTNKGPQIADSVVVTDNLPDLLTFISCSATGGGTCGGAGNARMVTFPLLALNASATITFEATVKVSITNGTKIDNTATVTTATNDPVASNNIATASVTVSTNPIAINCAANVTVAAAQGQTSAVVTYPSPAVVGNPPGVTVVCSPPSGSTFPLGTIPVTCTATDSANNKGSCSFTVTVNPFVPNNPLPDRTLIDFGSAIALPNQSPPSGTFALSNASAAAVDIVLASIKRTGSDVSAGKITNADDSGFFTVFAVNPGAADTQLNIGATVTIPVGQRSFRVMFNPVVPSVAAATSNLAANQVLPDLVASSVNFTTSDNRTLTINLTGRVASALRLIDPANTSRPPVVTFTKSGNQFTLSYSVFDSNLDVSRASHQFINSTGQPVEQALEVNLAQALQPLGLARGQSFTVQQPFSGASSHPEIAGVRVTVFDGETSVSATASLGPTSASATAADRAERVILTLPKRKLRGITP